MILAVYWKDKKKVQDMLDEINKKIPLTYTEDKRTGHFEVYMDSSIVGFPVKQKNLFNEIRSNESVLIVSRREAT